MRVQSTNGHYFLSFTGRFQLTYLTGINKSIHLYMCVSCDNEFFGGCRHTTQFCLVATCTLFAWSIVQKMQPQLSMQL